jgi:hypothetical protein
MALDVALAILVVGLLLVLQVNMMMYVLGLVIIEIGHHPEFVNEDLVRRIGYFIKDFGYIGTLGMVGCFVMIALFCLNN